MKEIKLTRGQVALVDDKDFNWLNQWKWHIRKGRSDKKWYATHTIRIGMKYKVILMHRFILGLTDSKIQCDHKDGDSLNNQRSNLRSATNTQNQQNKKKRQYCSSKYKGVTWCKDHQKWRVRIIIDRKPLTIGYFCEEIDAAVAYNESAKKHFKEFASLNELN